MERGVEEIMFFARGEDRDLSSLGETRAGAERKRTGTKEPWHTICRGPNNRAQRTKVVVSGRLVREDGCQMTVREGTAPG